MKADVITKFQDLIKREMESEVPKSGDDVQLVASGKKLLDRFNQIKSATMKTASK